MKKALLCIVVVLLCVTLVQTQSNEIQTKGKVCGIETFSSKPWRYASDL
jgi:hypothetical protein